MALTQRLDKGDYLVWDGENQSVIVHPYGRGIIFTQELDMIEISHAQMEQIIKLYKLIKKDEKLQKS